MEMGGTTFFYLNLKEIEIRIDAGCPEFQIRIFVGMSTRLYKRGSGIVVVTLGILLT